MDKPLLDLNGVKVYKKDDVMEAMRLIGHKEYYKIRLKGIPFKEDSELAYVCHDDCQGVNFKYFILDELPIRN